ncbi:MAG: Zn dependent protease [Comamonadaceae bacterium CG_4_9_14_3_um_filter_60_33]|nr:MAG: Zn dependent protease [Comamonadaceae bacterium CG_4_10_14_3_um_filter_60_42]PJB42530.1 MAG: Zn dependent protease [Comamonadaceae bacterium CG_4_9_14_3_um_filter_60_33]
MHAINLSVLPWRQMQLGAMSTLLALLMGCESIPKNLKELPLVNTFTSEQPSPKADLPPPIERSWPDSNQDVLNQRARGFGLVNSPELGRYLNGLYGRIKTQAGVPAWPGGVHILASDALQAYATGAGNIYVSLPWVTGAESEDEIVAVLSHEFGHIYLHYHQLEGAVADADTATGWLSIGVAIANKTANATGWTQVDSLMTAYGLGRGLVTTVYGRSQESAADSFGLNVSLKLGYSYEHGMKVFLERMASWEEVNEQREKDKNEKILQYMRQQAKDNAAKKSPKANNAVSQSLNEFSGELSGNMASAFQQVIFDINNASKNVRGDHPPIVERIDALAVALEPFPELQADQAAVVKPLKSTLQAKRTAELVANYGFAFKAISAPNSPTAMQLARKSTTGITAKHAVPLFALYTVLNEQQPAANRKKVDAGQVLEANFSSEPDRAWITYQERSSKLKDVRQIPEAKKVMGMGLAYFQNAEEAWPQAIRFYGETQGWDEAKRLAQNCGKNFRRVSVRCTQAATSPDEAATAERKSKEKADQITKKWFKTP